MARRFAPFKLLGEDSDNRIGTIHLAIECIEAVYEVHGITWIETIGAECYKVQHSVSDVMSIINQADTTAAGGI